MILKINFLAKSTSRFQNKYMNIIKKTAAAFVFFAVLTFSAYCDKINAAFLSIENMNKNPGYDYLQGIVEGLFMYDLSTSNDLILTERADIENVLEEQKLKFSGIIEDKDTGKQFGEIIGADFLLSGGYVFLGEDLLINMKAVNVTTGNATAFSARGYTENTIHELAEQVIFALTGEAVEIVSEEGKRSIISMRDESPGEIHLYSFIQNSEIFLDGEFAGYTTGNGRTAIILDDISPGIHKIRTHLNNSFGVIDLPEFTFRDWEEEFEVKPGKKIILRDGTRHFNDLIYDHIYLVWEGFKVNKSDNSPVQRIYSKSFTDRTGEEVSIELSVLAEPAGENYLFKVQYEYNGEKNSYEIVPEKGKDTVFEKNIGKTNFKLKINDRYEGRYEIDCTVKRTDIKQNMFRDKN